MRDECADIAMMRTLQCDQTGFSKLYILSILIDSSEQ